METTPSRASVIPAIAGLALLQQALNLVIMTALVPTSGGERNWGVATFFVVGSALINTIFYCAAWFGLLDAARVAVRLKRIYLGGVGAALFFFTLSCVLLLQVDPKGPFGSYAQVAVLVATLAAACKLDDARGALAPLENDPLKRD